MNMLKGIKSLFNLKAVAEGCRRRVGRMRFRHNVRKELRTAAERTSMLLEELERLPDEQSCYNYIAERHEREIFLTGGCYWRVWGYAERRNVDREYGVEVRNPVDLVGMAGAGTERGRLRIPAAISLPGLTLGVMSVEGKRKPCFRNDRQLIELEEYNRAGINLWGLEVEELEIPPTVTTLTAISGYGNLRHFRCPENFLRASGEVFLCDCPKLESIEFGRFTIEGCVRFFEGCPSLRELTVPDYEWVLQERKYAKSFFDWHEWMNIDAESLFVECKNKLSGLPIELKVKEGKAKYERIVIPSDFDEAERLADLFELFPNLYEAVKSIEMFPWIVKMYEEDPDDDCLDMDSWRVSADDNRDFRFSIDECVNLERLILPDTIRLLCSYCFAWNRKLREISLSSSLEFVGEGAFAGLSELKHIEFPPTVRKICDLAFAGTGLTEVRIPRDCRLEGTPFEPKVRIIRY